MEKSEQNENIEQGSVFQQDAMHGGEPEGFPDNAPTLRGYKAICVKLGLSMCVYFLCRLFAGWLFVQLGNHGGAFVENYFGLISSLLSIIFIYVIPLVVTVLIFRSTVNYKGKYRALYKKPKRLARAMGTFPATYGLGQGTALLTLLVMFLISRGLSGHTYIEELLRPTYIETPTNIASLLALMFILVIIAPLFEEFWVRGIMYDALKPYGVGIAIIITSIIFGLMHGSLYMLFYTTAFGFALGYIRYASGSLFVVTILHAIVNSIGAGALLFSTLQQMTNEENRFINTIAIIYFVSMLVMIVVGVVVFISKIPAIRKYRIENGWTEIGPWKKTAVFFISIPVILMVVLAFNEIFGGPLIRLILN